LDIFSIKVLCFSLFIHKEKSESKDKDKNTIKQKNQKQKQKQKTKTQSSYEQGSQTPRQERSLREKPTREDRE